MPENTSGSTLNDGDTLPPPSAQVAELIRRTRIVECRPLSMSAKLTGNLRDKAGVRIEIEQKVGLEGEGFDQITDCKVALVSTESGATFAEFNYALMCRYQVKGTSPSAAELNEFAKSAGVIDFWPFLRAFVTSSCGQLGLPPPPLVGVRFGTA